MAKLSIIVPIYKVEVYLGQCVQSILNQNFRDLELILVDDGSPDACPEKCDEWSKCDSRIKVIHKQNGGLRSAILAGLKIATGLYVGYVDGDDWVGPDYFEKLFQAAEETKADLVVAGWTVHDGNKILVEKTPFHYEMWTEGQIEELLYEYWEKGKTLPFGNSRCIKIWRTDKIRKLQNDLDEKLCMGEDLEQTLRFLPVCNSVVMIPHCAGYYYRSHPESVTHRFTEKVFLQYKLMEKMLRDVAVAQNRPYLCKEQREAELRFDCLYQAFASKQHFFSYVHWAKKILQTGPAAVPDNVSVVFKAGYGLLNHEHYVIGAFVLKVLFFICSIIYR